MAASQQALTPSEPGRARSVEWPLADPVRPHEEIRGIALVVRPDPVSTSPSAPLSLEFIKGTRQLAVQVNAQHTVDEISTDFIAGSDGESAQPFEREEPNETTVEIDFDRHRVHINGTARALSFKEFALVHALVQHEGSALSRTALHAVLINHGGDLGSSERAVDVHIRRIRLKLVPFGDIIRTVRGRGYRLDDHADVVVVGLPEKPAASNQRESTPKEHHVTE